MTQADQAIPAIGCDLVIFDCDGVLVDSEIISCSTLAEMLTEYGVPMDLPEALGVFLGRPGKLVPEIYLARTGKALPDTFFPALRERLFGRFEAGLQPIPGARSFIESLRQRGLPWCVASSSDDERIEFSLRLCGMWDLFEGRMFSTTMVRNGKPAPDLFLLAASRMGADPAHCLVVEDSISGVTAAKAAGMTAVGLTAGGHFGVLDNRAALTRAGADIVIDRMPALTDLIAARQPQSKASHGRK